MMDLSSYFLAEVMLWLMYIAMGVAVVATIVSAIRSFWLNKQRFRTSEQ